MIRARLSRREVLLRDRPEDRGSKTGCRSSRTSCSTRSSARRPSASSALSELARRSLRRWSAPIVGEGRARRAARQGRPAHRGGRRIPRGAGHDGEILRAGAGRGRSGRRTRSRITTARRARTISCRPIRSRSRSRSPTRSTRWSASGRSTRSRPGARIRMRCAGRRWGDPHRARQIRLASTVLAHRLVSRRRRADQVRAALPGIRR